MRATERYLSLVHDSLVVRPCIESDAVIGGLKNEVQEMPHQGRSRDEAGLLDQSRRYG